mgnify:CR=1 FL=1
MQFIALGPMMVVGALVFLTIPYATVINLSNALLWFLPAFFRMIPIHELIHAFASPSFGTSDGTLPGIWPSRLLFYAHYEGEIARERFLGVLAAPTSNETIAVMSASESMCDRRPLTLYCSAAHFAPRPRLHPAMLSPRIVTDASSRARVDTLP